MQATATGTTTFGGAIGTALRAGAWPAVMAGALGLHAALGALGVPVPARAWIAAAAGAVAVLALERWLPHRRAWRADRGETATDLVYLAAVQMALPAALGLTVAAAAVRGLADAGLSPAPVWPHAWPPAAQAALMLLVADLLRYALHVASHRFEPLWRLHAVHHAPARLHATNVGRFHPLEKALQYGLDALPFVLLGVGAPVLGLYFVFYAVNGFFQHGNADVRLGALNWLVSGPELHRWHHSRRASESCSNYGNNLIVWDVLFGTRFLPADRRVAELGLENRAYPTGIGAQLLAPFVRDLERTPRRVPGPGDLLMAAGLRARMAGVAVTTWRRLVAAARRPRETQLALLRDIVRRNRDTGFGRDHGFDAVADHADWCARVPVQTWESLQPRVERQDRTGEPALTAERPVLYARTSGTTAEPKLLPVTRRGLREQKRIQTLFGYCAWRAVPGAYDGRILAIASPAEEGRTPGGTPFGSASGHIYRAMPRLARAKYVVPPEVFDLADPDLKYRLVLRLALAVRDVTALGCANPSTILVLNETLRADRARLLRELASGGFEGLDALPDAVRRAVAPRLACTPERVAELRRVLAHEAPTLGDVWPGLRLVSTWTGGSCGVALESARTLLPAGAVVGELGYLSSEFRGTLPVDPARGACVPTLREHFFEFVEESRWEAGEPRFLLLDELREGCIYHVIVTTASGLYRYFMNDLVRVTGRFHATPTLAFVQKGRGVTNLTGEKLYEGQLLEAVKAAGRELGCAPRFLLATADARAARYRLFLEPDGPVDAAALAAAVDAGLCERNLEYEAKRASRRLGALEVVLLRRSAGEAYKAWCVARGQREGQWKTVALQYAEDVGFDFEALRS